MSRFGIARNLTFAIFHFIHPYPTLNMVDYLIPHPKDLMNDKKFAHKLNIVNVHSVFNKSAIDLFMPADTQLVATMRHPFTQLQSAFNYYNLKRHLHIPDVGDPLKEFLKDPAKYDKLLPGSMYNHISAITGIKLSFTKNRMAFEFGFDLTQIHNTTYVQQHLMHIKKSFNIVIITEHYDESLLLLRKQFCWQYKDILYLGLRNHTYTGKNKSPDSFGEYYKSHKQWAPLDYLIYDQFLKIHRNSVESQGPKFLDEVAHFKKVLQQVNRYCSDICSPKGFRNRSINYLTVAKSVFHNDFFVTPKDCGIMMVSDTYLQNTIKLYQYWTFCATKPNIHVLKQQQAKLKRIEWIRENVCPVKSQVRRYISLVDSLLENIRKEHLIFNC